MLDSLRSPSSYVWQWVLFMSWASQCGHSFSKSGLFLMVVKEFPEQERQPHITKIFQASVCVTFANIPVAKASYLAKHEYEKEP